MSALTKIINILDPQAGTIRETVLEDREPTRQLFESRRGMRPMTLREASTTAEFPVLLRDGIRAIAFDAYAGTATTWQNWVQQLPSDKQSEDWVEENMLGEFPIVHEGTPYPEIKRDIDRTLNIRNYKRGDIYTVTEEMIRFNKVGLIRMDAGLYGRRAANTREQACFSVLTTAGTNQTAYGIYTLATKTGNDTDGSLAGTYDLYWTYSKADQTGGALGEGTAGDLDPPARLHVARHDVEPAGK